jgi:hypothetical protein
MRAPIRIWMKIPDVFNNSTQVPSMGRCKPEPFSYLCFYGVACQEYTCTGLAVPLTDRCRGDMEQHKEGNWFLPKRSQAVTYINSFLGLRLLWRTGYRAAGDGAAGRIHGRGCPKDRSSPHLTCATASWGVLIPVAGSADQSKQNLAVWDSGPCPPKWSRPCGWVGPGGTCNEAMLPLRSLLTCVDTEGENVVVQVAMLK